MTETTLQRSRVYFCRSWREKVSGNLICSGKNGLGRKLEKPKEPTQIVGNETVSWSEKETPVDQTKDLRKEVTQHNLYLRTFSSKTVLLCDKGFFFLVCVFVCVNTSTHQIEQTINTVTISSIKRFWVPPILCRLIRNVS